MSKMTALIFKLVTVLVVSRTIAPADFSNRTAQLKVCQEEEYLDGKICCKKCEAGQYVKSPCTSPSTYGQCEACADGKDYTEHANGLKRCIHCSRCRSDQVETVPCTIVQNRQCQCKPGYFCRPEEACEVCKKCSRCKEEMAEVHSCNATADTVCAKPSPATEKPRLGNTDKATTSAGTVITIVIVIIIGIVLVISLVLWKKRKCSHNPSPGCSSQPSDVKIPIDGAGQGSVEERQNSLNAGTEQQRRVSEGEPLLQNERLAGATRTGIDDEDRGLGDSLSNTANSSQTSLAGLPSSACSSSTPRHSPPTQRQDLAGGRAINENTYIPLEVSESLKKSFAIFTDQVGVKDRKKFLRHIGVKDNDILKAEKNIPADVDEQFYQLLTGWQQDKGKNASIELLLNALLELGHRHDAENIIQKVIENNYYKLNNENE
nr:PREDICTED: tumor necrosis factor receptor superfamily member 10B-like isoform X1 [Lepisosteus oculatus]